MNRKNVGQNIRLFRRQCGMTQAQMAEKTGVSTDHISHVEIGSGTISLPLLIEICKLLRVSPNDILSGEYEAEFPKNTAQLREGDSEEMEISSDRISSEDLMLLQHMYQYMVGKKK